MITGEVSAIMAKHPSIRAHIQAQNFARRAFHGHLHGAAADFAIGGEPLRGLAGVNEHFKFLPAKWALNKFRFLHKTCGGPGMRIRLTAGAPLVVSFRVGWLSSRWHRRYFVCYGLGGEYEI